MTAEVRTVREKGRGSILAAEPGLTAGDLVLRAESMRTTLRKRQSFCEESGRWPPETNDEFIRAGFYRTLQPRRFGGYEFFKVLLRNQWIAVVVIFVLYIAFLRGSGYPVIPAVFLSPLALFILVRFGVLTMTLAPALTWSLLASPLSPIFHPGTRGATFSSSW